MTAAKPSNARSRQKAKPLRKKPWHYELKLKRRRSYSDNHIFYDLTLTRVFEDATIKPEEIERTTYPGADRYAAFSAYEAKRKAYPGIIAEKDIEKAAWER